jgi:glycogen synthase
VVALLDALELALELYESQHFFAMRESAMMEDVSWHTAAEQWEAALAGMMTAPFAPPIATSTLDDL